MTRLAMVLAFTLPLLCAGQEYEQAPIAYTDTAADNPVSKLIDELKAGRRLPSQGPQYRLQALLSALKIPVSSQVLVVSHTSLQSDRINPVNPRAIYFNDDITLGFVPDGLIELTVLDPKLGTAFYIMENDPDEEHLPEREINRCVMCHVSNLTRNVPGLQVRSVHVNAAGAPNFRFGGSRVDHTTELSKRWGGWFVTGTTGSLKHLGNIFPTPPGPSNFSTNLRVLDDEPGATKHLTKHSDVVALLVLEHQAEASNQLVRAAYTSRTARHLHGQPAKGSEQQLADQKAREACDSAADYLTFVGQAMWKEPIAGSTSYRDDFQAMGEHYTVTKNGQPKSQSLRQFHLSTRLFRLPISYMLESTAFRSLDASTKRQILARMKANLLGQGKLDRTAFSAEEIQDSLAILSVIETQLTNGLAVRK